MAHHPKKHFSQNFLQDPSVIEAILTAFHPEPFSNVVEIGPGLGALTKPLLRQLDALTAIEIDGDLCEHLKSLPMASKKLTLIQADALKVDFGQLGENLRLIGNLPYHISTPLLFHVLRDAHHIQDMHWMLQKEVVERLVANPGCKAYGRLSIAAQFHAEVEYLFTVERHAFYPEPKVESAVMRMTPYKISPYPEASFWEVEQIAAIAFSMRRKTLANNFKNRLTHEDWRLLGINANLRPEQLSVTDYVQIAKYCRIQGVELQ